jgi:predicted TIM-barrel fold metal-dependent hydrolase
MFGTDYPMISPETWLESFEQDTDFSEEIQRKILFENAEEFFDL